MVSVEEAQAIASLARLNVDDAARSLNSILGYVERLNEIDTTGVEPLAHPLDLKNVFRDDEPAPSLPVNEALANAPKRDGDYFVVPSVL
jgi:aspartyl-tRNA(Asn)/glutamyl-tRNA(Gln) amidotransferase subunit C